MLNPCVSQIWQNFGGDEYLCKLGKEYLNASLCIFLFFTAFVFLPLTIAELLMLKQFRFFVPPCRVTPEKWAS